MAKPNLTSVRKKEDPMITRSTIDFADSPEYIAYIINQANYGNTYELYKYARIIEEKDFEISGLLNLRKSRVNSARAFAVPKNNSPEAITMADFCEDKMSEIMPSALSGMSDFEGLLDNCMHALNTGISFSQIHWGEGGSYIKGFEYFDPTYFSFQGSYQPYLKYRSSEKKINLDERKWIFHTHNPRGGDMTRGGLIRPLIYLYYFKKHVYQFNIRAIEKVLIPFVSLMVDHETFKDDKRMKELENKLTAFGADGGGIFTEGSEFNYNEVKGSQAEIYDKFHTMCRRQASQLIIGSDSGVFAEGSNRSTASVQDSVRKSMTMNDTSDLRRTIRNQIFKPLIEYNFGAGRPIPDVEFKFDVSTKEVSEIMKDMYSAGYTMPVDELNKLTGMKWEKIEGQAPEIVGE